MRPTVEPLKAGMTVEDFIATIIGEPTSRHDQLERQAIGRIVRKEMTFIARMLDKDPSTVGRKLPEFMAGHPEYIARELAIPAACAALMAEGLPTMIAAWAGGEDPEQSLLELATDRTLSICLATYRMASGAGVPRSTPRAVRAPGGEVMDKAQRALRALVDRDE